MPSSSSTPLYTVVNVVVFTVQCSGTILYNVLHIILCSGTSLYNVLYIILCSDTTLPTVQCSDTADVADNVITLYNACPVHYPTPLHSTFNTHHRPIVMFSIVVSNPGSASPAQF